MLTFLAGWRSELAGCRSTLSMSKIKVRISETKYRSFYKTLVGGLFETLLIVACVEYYKLLESFISDTT